MVLLTIGLNCAMLTGLMGVLQKQNNADVVGILKQRSLLMHLFVAWFHFRLSPLSHEDKSPNSSSFFSQTLVWLVIIKGLICSNTPNVIWALQINPQGVVSFSGLFLPQPQFVI